MIPRLVAWTSLAVALASCIEAQLTVCADGRACPNGLQCDEVHMTCVLPEQLTACAGADDLLPCSTPRIPNGVCSGGVCLPTGCGNQVVEAGERCDDGNLTSGDGCSADCFSREACGDGFVDENADEECDDGDHAGGDGCTATCITETVFWQRQSDLLPGRRAFAATTYDPIRKVAVTFGGRQFDSNTALPLGFFNDLADTWEWNGAQWREITPLFSPPARHDAAIAYDPKRHRIVLFGGFNRVFGALNDTWEYDGATWRNLAPASSPPGGDGAMAWDPRLGRIVLFDGNTWTWDGAAWTRIDTPQAPPGRSHPSLAYDAARERLLMFGGSVPASPHRTDLWAFDGFTWSEVTTTGGPPSSSFLTALVYDPIHRVPIAITDENVGTYNVDMWELSGTTWRQLTTLPFAPFVLLEGTSWTFDIARGVLVEFAGASLTAEDNRTFEYDFDVAWREAVIASPPSPRFGAALAYDPVRARVVMGAGTSTSEWDGIAWTTTSVVGPAVRAGHASVYDGVTRRVLLFGGGAGGAVYGDTWTWDGAAWLDVTPVISPAPRTEAAMAYDSVRQRVVMTGGVGSTGLTLGDTWEWDGAAWRDATVAAAPRGAGVMAFDSVRGRMVVYTATAETWEWDGAMWAHQPVTGPGLRERPAMVYDGARDRVTLFGGERGRFSQWEWNGTSWTQVAIGSIPPDRRIHIAATYDLARAEIVLFGGAEYFPTPGDQETWLGAYRGPDMEVCGSGHDVDRDGSLGCADEDCAAACERCGDGACNGAENDRLCPGDCPAAAAICGDAFCAPGESLATCAADCTP